MTRRNGAHNIVVRILLLTGIVMLTSAVIVWTARRTTTTPVIVGTLQNASVIPAADQTPASDPIELLKRSGAIVFALPMSHDMTEAGFTPDGRHIIVAGYGQVWMCNAITGENENDAAYDNLSNRHGGSLSTDGTHVLRGDGAGQLDVFSLGGIKPLFVLHQVGDQVAYSQDGRYLATAMGGYVSEYSGSGIVLASVPPGPIVIREGSTGKIVRQLKSPYKTIGALMFSADGKSLYLTDRNGAESAGFWDAVTGQLRFALDKKVGICSCYAVSPDGHWFCSPDQADLKGSGNPPESANALICNAQTGALEHTLTGLKNRLYAATFSRDSRLLATTDVSSSVRIWDTMTWKLLRTLTIPADYVRFYRAAFSPDGKRLVTCGSDIIVWNIADLMPDKLRP